MKLVQSVKENDLSFHLKNHALAFSALSVFIHILYSHFSFEQTAPAFQ
jgi:hypothetical protein